MAHAEMKNAFVRAMVKAQALGSPVAGPGHLILVLLDGPVSDPARRALEAAGVSSDQVVGVTGRSRRRGTTANPALMRVDGFAEGLAVARGERRPSTTDLLVSLCWHPNYWVQGRDPRRAILRHLEEEGVPLPSARLPRWDRIRLTQSIEIERGHLDAAIALLKKRHPIGSHPRWGFNYRPRGKAELAAEDGIDLERIVSESSSGG